MAGRIYTTAWTSRDEENPEAEYGYFELEQLSTALQNMKYRNSRGRVTGFQLLLASKVDAKIGTWKRVVGPEMPQKLRVVDVVRSQVQFY